MADGASSNVSYNTWTAEDVVNAVVVPPTPVPSRQTVLNESWISQVWTGTAGPSMGSWDYLFGFKYVHSGVTTFVGMNINKSIRDGSNGSGGGAGNMGYWNAYIGAMQDAVAFYTNSPGTPTARTGGHGGFSYTLGGRGGGSDPNTMDVAAEALTKFHDWLKGGNGEPGAAPVLNKWVKWLGSEHSGWQGTAADVVFQLITELGDVLDGWAGQIDGTGSAGSQGPTLSMTGALDDSGYALAVTGNYLNHSLAGWKEWASSQGDNYEYYKPENAIRLALARNNILVRDTDGGFAADLGGSAPADRFTRFEYSSNNDTPFGGPLTVDQIWSALMQSPGPNSAIQTAAKQNWLYYLQKLDANFGSALNTLAAAYKSAGTVLIPLRTATVHALDAGDVPSLGGGDVPSLGGGDVPSLGVGGDVPSLGGDVPTPDPLGVDPGNFNSLLADPSSGSFGDSAVPPLSDLSADPSLGTSGGNVPDVSSLFADPSGGTSGGGSLPSLGDPNVSLAAATPDPFSSGSLPPLTTGADWNAALGGPGSVLSGGPFGSSLLGLGPLSGGVLGPGGTAGLAGLNSSGGGSSGGVAAEASPFGAVPGSAAGENSVPLYPPTGGGAGAAGADGSQERERHTWISEDEAVWGADPDLPPAVLGRA